MLISSYDGLITAANQQLEPQRILFVFAKVELPTEHSDVEAEQFHAGQGGNLVPVVCVDKALNELGSFADLFEESKQTGQDWKIVFVACLDGNNGIMPTSIDSEIPLQTMQINILTGKVSGYLAYDREGNQIRVV